MRSLSSLVFFLLSTAVLAQSPHGNSISIDCSHCHESATWNIKSNLVFNHDETNFKLTGQHKTLECRSCHSSLVFTNVKSDCFSCHKDIHQNSVGFDCQKCHSTNTWIVKDIQQVHRLSRFPLAGAHQRAECIQCHTEFNNLNFQPVGIGCYSCHINDFSSAQNPNHTAAHFSTECQDCHNMTDNTWSAKNFAHDFFALQGMHKLDNCFACHKQGSFTGLSKDCYSCHQKDFVAVKDPDHVKGNFSHDCIQCHNTQNPFSFSTFNHSATSFPLTGVHSQAQCSNCHQTGYQNTSTACVSCHQINFNNSTNPNHITLALSTDCQTCHNVTNPGFKPALFTVHDNFYQLLGAHALISTNCATCHNGNYNNTPNTCYGCHQQNYSSTTNPPHATTGFNTECTSCHNQNAWVPSTFNHDQLHFPIYSGKHNGKWSVCSDCHTNSTNYNVFSCIDCHEHNKSQTDSEHNGVSGYVYASAQCYACHPRGTKEGAFDHSLTNFPLTGAHVSVSCTQCHTSGYAGTSTACVSCHQTNYNNANNPNHTATGLSTECQTCHNTTAFVPSTFNHTNTGFTLTGQHTTIQCSSCHVGTTAGLSQQCISCHQNAYNAASGHVQQNYPTTCELCHSTTAWNQSTFNHGTTQFPLTGAHTTVLCSNCHQGGYTGTSTECVSCHQANYNNATNPNHINLGLAATCTTCHTTNPDWKPAAFPAHNNYYQLVGAHSLIANNCSGCHNGNYNNTPNTCYDCHVQDFQNANPNHIAPAFPHDCTQCHTQSAWLPSTFAHDQLYFPIYSGKHNNRWSTCSDCHSNQANYSEFTCITCHKQQKTNKDHKNVSGYQYVSSACYSCHPNGSNLFMKTSPNIIND